MKKLGIILIVLVAIIGGVWYWLSSLDINGLVKEQIEVNGTKVMGTQVLVRHVDIKFFDGKGQIGGLSIANPAGYKATNAFNMNVILLDLGTESLEPVVIEELLIDGPQLIFEANEMGGGNLMEIKDNLAKAIPASSEPNAENKETEASKQLPNIAVQKVTLKDVALTMDLQALGLKEYSETLPTLTLSNVGTPNGLPADQLGLEISKRVFAQLTDEVIKKQKEKIAEKAENKLKEKVKDKLSEMFN